MTGTTARLLLLGPSSPLSDALARRAERHGTPVLRARDTTEEAIERAVSDASAAEVPVAIVLGLQLADPAGPMGDWTLAAWEDAVVAPLRTAYAVARTAVEEFLAAGAGGRLLYLASTEAGGPGCGVIRGALAALVRSVAKEYGAKGVGCNAVLAEAGAPEHAERAAATAWLLLAPAGAYVTGEVVELAAGVSDASDR